MPSSAFRTCETATYSEAVSTIVRPGIFQVYWLIAIQRKILDHIPPSFVGNSAWFFITICCRPKGLNQICFPAISEVLLEDAAFYHTEGRWYLNIFLLMPDHVHLIAAFPTDGEMSKIIGSWKRLTARRAGISWQRNYFDHRIRADEGLEQKVEYVRQNPVRAGLVKRQEDWPYFWEQRES